MLTKNMPYSSNWSRFLIITVLALGLFFRFANLDQKYYWYDEAVTSLRISGYTEEQVAQQVFTGQEISVSSLQKFQNPNPQKGIIDTVKGIAQYEPQLTPLYFILLRFWTNLFGGSVTLTRSFSAVISLLTFPCIYWLCRELFKSPLVGWIAILLVAVSPFHLLYAQEARMYSLWTVTTLLSSAALLRAMRLKTLMSWVIYTITLTLGLYTNVLTVLTALGYGIYVFAIGRFRLTKTLTSYTLASLVSLILFLPWIMIFLQRTSEVGSRLAWADDAKPNLLDIAKSLLFQCSRLFFDLGIGGESSNFSILLISPVAIIFLALIVYSVYYLCQTTPKNTWLFVLTLITVLPISLIFRDLVKGGMVSNVMRYLIPGYLGIQIAVTYLLAQKITDFSISIQHRKFWHLVIAILLLCGIISCTVISSAISWWHTGDDNKYYFQAGRIINKSNQPLVVSSGSLFNTNRSIVGSVLSLSHVLDHKVKLVLTIEPEIPTIPNNSADVFLFQIPDSLLSKYKQEYEIKPAVSQKLANGKNRVWLWRLGFSHRVK